MEREKRVSKTLIQAGSLISGVGVIVIAEAILTQHGVIGSAGLLVEGVGTSIILTGVRRRKKI